ncbi:hypothetical protein SPRG_17728, partial [Saprolegnia parasitica CBS 223.65]
MPTQVVPSESAPRPARAVGHGMALSLLYLAFASTVAVCTYYLSAIANTPIFLGHQYESFTSNQFNIPVRTLLRASIPFPLSTSMTLDTTLSLSDLLYKKCGVRDEACATSFLPRSNEIWYLVAKAFALIPNFDQPRFQNSTQTITIQHINNLSGWNKATAQFSIDGHDMAITCMVRRASFNLASAPASSAVIDSIAFCSPRKFDPNWICENKVALDVATYAIQVSRGTTSYLGVAARKQVYLNPGHIATFMDGPLGPVLLRTVRAIDEYQGGILQMHAPWDVLPACSCIGTLDEATGLGWLEQIQGMVTMTWECDSLMLTNAIILWVLAVDFTSLQWVYLRRSAICLGPVYMSKSVVGLVILFVGFWGNANLQTLTTLLHHKPGFDLGNYAYCGPAQMASIVGIMTGTLIQTWFNPRLVTQTWLLLVFSLVNWILVFVLEAFVFPGMSSPVPGPCGRRTSTNCLLYNKIAQTYYYSAIASGGVVLLAIAVVYFHALVWSKGAWCKVPRTHSVLQYLAVKDLTSVVTSVHSSILFTDDKDSVGIDAGVLLIKNMIQVSSTAMTRTSNVQYDLLFRLIPTARLKAYYSSGVGSVLVVHIRQRTISRRSSYTPLHTLLSGTTDAEIDEAG